MNMKYETERLSLRILNESYYMQVLTFLSRNQALFDHYEIKKPPEYYTADYQRKLLCQEYNQILKKVRLRFYVFLKSNPQRIIGTVSYSSIRPGFHSCQIGYKFDSGFHHHGYAYEALLYSIPIAKTEFNLHRLEAYVYPGNQPSVRLMERLGFLLEGTARDYALLNGRWENHLVYSLIV